MMFDRSNLSAGAIIEFNCQGEAGDRGRKGEVAWHKLVYRDGKINKRKIEVCQQRHVRIAHNNERNAFEWYNTTVTIGDDGVILDNMTGMMMHGSGSGEYDLTPLGVAYTYEQYASFFTYWNLSTSWHNCNFTWGWKDGNTSLWNGALGEVSRKRKENQPIVKKGDFIIHLILTFTFSACLRQGRHWPHRFFLHR